MTGPTGATGPTGPTGATGTSDTSIALATSTGTISQNELTPLTAVINTSDGDILIDTTTNQITLTEGTYHIAYSGVATNATGNAELSLYQDGTQIPSSQSSATLEEATDTASLYGSTVISTTDNTVIDLRNSGASAFTLNNLSFTVTKIS